MRLKKKGAWADVAMEGNTINWELKQMDSNQGKILVQATQQGHHLPWATRLLSASSISSSKRAVSNKQHGNSGRHILLTAEELDTQLCHTGEQAHMCYLLLQWKCLYS